MEGMIDLPRGFNLGRETVHDWTQRFAITRERDGDGSDQCICWVGTFSLITTDAGGWFPDEGAALGVKPDGTTVTDGNWSDSPVLAEAIEDSKRNEPSMPLAWALRLAQQMAKAASAFLPAVDASLDAGDTLEQFEAAMDEYLASFAGETREGVLLGAAFGLLWLSEQARRDEG
jgi:hypothetical protein